MSDMATYQTFLINKVSSRKDYFAFFITQYQEYEQLNDEQMKSFLECSDNNFFRLALCRVPDMHADTFTRSIQKIADFANVPVMKLIRMLKRVSGLEVMQQAAEKMHEETLLLAARQKTENEEDTNNEHEEP